MPQLVKELSHIIASGGLRVINPGDVFLLRFDDRLIWLSFIERGYGYYRVSAKGLELQQTSCHAVEASAIDAILEWTFETPEDSRKKCRLNKSPFHVYSPLNIAVIETYVETRNVLTGVIHSSDTLQAISDCFPKCLIWILARYMTSKNNSLKTDTTELKSNRHSKLEKNVDNPEQHMIKSNSITKVESNSPRSRPSTAEHYARLPKAPSVHCVNTSVLEPLDDPWLDEDDPLDLEFEKAKTKSPALLQSFIGFLNITDDTSVMSQLNSSQLPGRIDETTFETVLEKKGEDVMERIRGPKDKPLRSDSLRESYLAAGFPEAWMNSPVSQNVINLLTPHFPSEWFEFVLTKVVDHDRKQLTSITSANVVLSYRHLVLTSHSIINQIQNGGKKTTISPSLVYRTFIRDLPWSPATNWLMKTPLLLDLVIAAYR